MNFGTLEGVDDTAGTDSDEDRLTILYLAEGEENGAKEDENGAKRKDKTRQKPKKNSQKTPASLRAKVIQVEASLKELDAVIV